MSAYPPFIREALDAYLSGETLGALLVDEFFEQDATMEFVDDVVAFEIAPAGYSRATLTGVSVEYNDLTGDVFILCDDVPFGTFDQPGVLGPIFFIDNGSDATNRLIAGATDDAATDIDNAVACVYRIDPDQGILVGATLG